MANSKFIRRGNDTMMPGIVCGVAFCVFSFTYLYFYQDNLLAMEQHILSNGLTRYSRLGGAVVLTILAALLQFAVDAATRQCIKHPALTYFPSAMMLAIITDISAEVDSGYTLGKWLWLAPLLLTMFAAAAYVSASLLANNEGLGHKSQARMLAENLTITVLTMLFIVATANTDRTFHRRMKAENLILQGKYTDALDVGANGTPADPSLTMLNAYALSMTSALGECLFEYNPTGGSDALLPGYGAKAMLLPEDRLFCHVARPLKQNMRPLHYLLWMRLHHHDKKPLQQYLLCAYLMDGRIDDFAKELAKDTAMLNNDRLPKHYREALVLYTHLRTAPLVNYQNSVMEADYNDLQTIARTTRDSRQRKALIQKTYGNTYWYYYMYGRKKQDAGKTGRKNI